MQTFLKRGISLGLSVALGCIVFVDMGCDGDDDNNPPPPPDSTKNNTFETAWNVNLPYSAQITVPTTDSREFFHFGIGESKVFGAVILVKLKLVEPTGKSFYLRAELFTEDKALLVDSRDLELAPSVWVASRPQQTYYLRLTPIGTPDTDRYTYSLSIEASWINDPLEPDNDTADATQLILGVESDAYLVDAFSDSIEPMTSLPDFYSFELEDTTMLYVRLSRLGGDSKPLLILFNPTRDTFAWVKDSAATFDLTGPEFEAGEWFLEVTDERGYYPSYGKGGVPPNYLEPYTLVVSLEPQ